MNTPENHDVNKLASPPAQLAPVSGSVYRFSTFQELVDRVPGDRIRDCMEELGTIFASAKFSTQLVAGVFASAKQLVAGVARNLAEADDKELPTEPKQIIRLPPEFEWIDDGRRELEARIVDSNGSGLFNVKIKSKSSSSQK